MKNEPAFPCEHQAAGLLRNNFTGLSKREWMAGLAMQNLQNVLLRKSGHDLLARMCETQGTKESEMAIAFAAVKQAAALLAALEEK